MKRIAFFIITLLTAGYTSGQFAPAANHPGSTAIYKDSSIITGWATRCYVYRGWQDINDTSLGKVTHGTPDDALGPADNQVVSLGDSGYAIIVFPAPLTDREGYDFAVFENAFDDNFLELAFVEVSSDSIHWIRFPSVSLTDTSEQVGTFGSLQPEKIHNLAGKYRVLYGTPFDLADVADSPGVDITHIRYLKIVDVIGSVKTGKCSTDSQGHKINDPYPTAFETGGFDLDAVAILQSEASLPIYPSANIVKIYPNPATDYLQIKAPQTIHKITIYDSNGHIILVRHPLSRTTVFHIKSFAKGIYGIRIVLNNGKIITKKIVKQ